MQITWSRMEAALLSGEEDLNFPSPLTQQRWKQSDQPSHTTLRNMSSTVTNLFTTTLASNSYIDIATSEQRHIGNITFNMRDRNVVLTQRPLLSRFHKLLDNVHDKKPCLSLGHVRDLIPSHQADGCRMPQQ